MGALTLTAMSQVTMCDSAEISSTFSLLRQLCDLGAQLASRCAQVLGFFAVASLLPGCLVTDEIKFSEPENHPPMFVPGARRVAQGDLIYADKDERTSWPFALRVRDIDIAQDLEVHWRVVTQGSDLRRRTIALPAEGSALRDFELIVNPTDLSFDYCHRVDVAVSGSFNKPFDDEPEDPFDFNGRTDFYDLVELSFYIWEGDPSANDPIKLVETCPTQLYEPPTVTTGGAAGEGVQ